MIQTTWYWPSACSSADTGHVALTWSYYASADTDQVVLAECSSADTDHVALHWSYYASADTEHVVLAHCSSADTGHVLLIWSNYSTYLSADTDHVVLTWSHFSSAAVSKLHFLSQLIPPLVHSSPALFIIY